MRSYITTIMNFSHEQKKAIVWTMVSVIMADCKVAPEEENLIIQIISNELNESISILNEASALTQSYVVSILKVLSDEQKNIIVNYWERLMMVDSHIDPKELHVIIAMGNAIEANVSAFRWLLGGSISILPSLKGTTWSNIDSNFNISFDSNSVNGCVYNGTFGIYHYDRLNDLIQISIDDCGLSKNVILSILSQNQNSMTVTLNGKRHDLIRK